MNRPALVAVWDIPTRIFHWVLAALFGLSWWSAKAGHMDWHYRSGLAVVALLLFRILWGFFGGSTARFANFIRGPKGVAAYLKGEEPPLPGHNPLGGWSVVAMLFLLAVQVGTGLFSVDLDGLESGPLSYLVDFDSGRTAAGLHETSFDVLLAFIGLHIVTIVYYFAIRRRNLIGPMVTGRDRVLSSEADPLRRGNGAALAVAMATAAGFAWWIASGAPL